MASFILNRFRSTPPPPSPASPSPAPSLNGSLTSALPPPALADLLLAYTSPLEDGTPAEAPKGSRIDRSLTQTTGKRMFIGWGIKDIWKAGWFLADRANLLARELVTHTVYGPRKKSWGLEMTIITSFLRNIGQHSSLTDITFLRALIALTAFVPLPPSTLVTPVSFRVRCRDLKGILAEFDEHEKGGRLWTGSGKGRELTGEWVVDKALWSDWQREFRQGKSRKHSGVAEEKKAGVKGGDRIVLFLHGGAYYIASASSHRIITIQIAKQCEARVFALNYRLAPETRFPGPLHDAVSAYFRLIDDLKIPPENILLAGDSAGGGLCLALLMYLRDNDYPLPSGAMLMSPWVDLTMSCDSWDSNAPFDVVPRPEPNDHLNPIFCYLGEEGVKKYLTHPYASPLFGDFTGLPPLLIQSGEAEVLRDEQILLAHKATLAGVLTMHEMFEDAVHVFHSFPFLEATRVAFESQRDFVFSVLPLHAAPAKPLAPEMNAALGSEIESADSKVVAGDGAELSEEDEQKTRQLWEEEEGRRGAAGPLQRLDTASSTSTEEDDLVRTPPTDQETAVARSAVSMLGIGLGELDSSKFANDTEDDEPGQDEAENPTPDVNTFRTPRSRTIVLPTPTLPTILEPLFSSSDNLPFATSSRPKAHSRTTSSTSHATPSPPPTSAPRLTRSITSFVTSTSTALSSRISSYSVTSSPIRETSNLPSFSGATLFPRSSIRSRLPQFNVNVQELVPNAPKTRSRSLSHPEVADLVRRFSSTGYGNGEENSAPTSSGGPGSPYRVKLYTPGKSGRGRELSEDGFFSSSSAGEAAS